jgi:hypothetical protein
LQQSQQLSSQLASHDRDFLLSQNACSCAATARAYWQAVHSP